MKIGVIIVFHNNEKNIDTNFFVEHLNHAKNLELCFVNNASKDKTYQVLKEVKEMCLSHVSLIDIKKFKSDISAMRSGARFMFNRFDLNYMGYISTNLMNNKIYNINTIVKVICENQNTIINYNINEIKKKQIKRTLFQNVFSITAYLDKLKLSKHFVNV